MKKNILILPDIFPPAFAPRMGYLNKYLENTEWNTHIISEYIKDEYDFSFLNKHAENLHFFHYYKTSSKIEWIYKQILDFFFDYKNKKMYAFCKKEIKNKKIDLVLCSAYMTFPMEVAYKIAKKNKIPLIIDLRDIIEQYPNKEYLSKSKLAQCFLSKAVLKKRIKKRNKILKKADYITTVSEWHVKYLKKINQNIKLIYNGFDPELFYPQIKKTKKFTLSYTGRIHSLEMQDPSLIFSSIEICINENLIDKKDILIQWYIDKKSKELILNEAKKHHIEDIMEFNELIDASLIPSVLNKSSINLVLTNENKDKGSKGIMTTKFFEALAVEKPILCVKSDQSYLGKHIKETSSGLATANKKEVVDFLFFYYSMWKEKAYTSINSDKQAIKKFSRATQAQEFVELFNTLLKKQDI